MYIFFVCVYLYVCECVHVCVMYYGSAEDTRTRFSKLLDSDVCETYVSDSRGKEFSLLSSNVVSIFVFSKNLPGDFSDRALSNKG